MFWRIFANARLFLQASTTTPVLRTYVEFNFESTNNATIRIFVVPSSSVFALEREREIK